MQRFIVGIVLLILIPVHIYVLGTATEQRKLLPKGEESTFVLPTPILRITALDFRGIASDFMFLKALVFIGSTFERKERPRVKVWEWKWFYHTLEASAALDPYFLDPYYVANSNLTWGVMMIRETNALLEKGARYRDWDPFLPFSIGFNYFYFLKENDIASTYLMEASRRPGASPIYASLATKLAYKSHRTENAILFIEQILKKTEDETLKKEFEARLEALRAILYLENAVNTYEKKFGRTPKHLGDLIKKGIIQEVPKDPYNGEFFVNSHGVVKSTSEYLLLPYHR